MARDTNSYRSSRMSRYHPYRCVRAPRHHSDSFMTPLAHLHDPAARPSSPPAEPRLGPAALPMEIAGEISGLKVEAEEGVEEGVDAGVEEDVAVERRPIQPGLAALGGCLLNLVTAVWREYLGTV